MRILLDLDCCLADFVGAAAKLWGLTFADLKPHWPAGEYGMTPVLDRACGAKYYEGNTGPWVTEKSFWNRIEGQKWFWTDIPKLPWCDELLELVRTTTDDWWIVTSPSRCPRCIPEKREWVHKVLGVPTGDWFDRLVPTPHKELMAKPGVVLIDDYDRNCKEFIKEGGHAITFPAWHNGLHAHHTDPMPSVRGMLETYLTQDRFKTVRTAPTRPAYHGER